MASPDLATCTFKTCAIGTSYYGYRPNLGINIFFAIVYGLIISTCLIFIAFYRKSWFSYTVVLAVGTSVECAGYILRACGHKNPWNITPFVIQFVFLTIAPIFMSASIYLSLERIAELVGNGYFNINPKLYPRVFVVSDVIALAIQSVGGAMSTNQNPNNGMPVGVKITIVGLVLQLVSLCTFSVLFSAIVIPGYRKKSRYSEQISQSDPDQPNASSKQSGVEERAELARRKPPQAFIIVILVATILILIRSAYRVAELSNGLQGGLETNQWAFMIMDGLLVLVASSFLAWGHPILSLR